MLNRREECNIYLIHICRHRWSRGEPGKNPATGLAESSLYFICSLGSLCSSDVCRCEWGRWYTLTFFLTFFIFFIFSCQVNGENLPSVTACFIASVLRWPAALWLASAWFTFACIVTACYRRIHADGSFWDPGKLKPPWSLFLCLQTGEC